MVNWRNMKTGDVVQYSWDDFDGSGTLSGVVVYAGTDHVIVDSDGEKLWLDDSTADMFILADSL